MHQVRSEVPRRLPGVSPGTSWSALSSRLPRPGPVVLDSLLALAMAGMALASLVTTPEGQLEAGARAYDGLGVALLLAQQGALAWRSRFPLAALAAAVALMAALRVLGYPLLTVDGVALLLLLYSAGAHGPASRRGRVTAAAVIVTSALATNLGTPAFAPDAVVGLSALMTGVYVMGDVVRRHRAARVLLEHAAEQARVLHEQRLRQAVLEERAHISRELHDIVAHSLAFIVAESDAGLRVMDDDPGRARAALGTVGATGRSGLRDMRRLLLVLRDDGGAATGTTGDRDARDVAALAPQPTLDDLDGLVRTARDAGLTVHLTRHDATPARGALPPALELSAYRIVQEALTNVLKHAGPARAFVDVRREEDRVSVEVVDTGREPAVTGGPTSAAAAGAGTGAGAGASAGRGDVPHGLVGMRERAALFGGRVEAGRLPDGGWRVSAVLPTDRGET